MLEQLLRWLQQQQAVRQPQPVTAPVSQTFHAQERGINRPQMELMDQTLEARRKPMDDFWNQPAVRGLGLEDYIHLQQLIEQRDQMNDRRRTEQSRVWM